MTDPTDLPPLSDDARAFLARHEATGEPGAAEVARVRARVLASAPVAPPAQAPPRRARRLLVSGELLAVAAVIAVLLGARALYVATRPPEPPAVRGPQAQAVIDAYAAGDLPGAQRLATQHCGEASCAALASSLARVVGLSQRLDALPETELDELARLDAELSGGRSSPLAARIAERREPAPGGATGPELYDQATDATRAKDYEAAVVLLRQCLRADPAFHPCQRQLGSVWARIAMRDQDARAMEEARTAYERFLAIAPPDDEYVPKVRQILAQAPPPGALPPRPVAPPPTTDDASSAVAVAVNSLPVAELLDLAGRAKARDDWASVYRLAQEVLERQPGHPRAQALFDDARHHAKETYLRGYQLKDSQPDQAVKLFRDVMAMTPPDDALHQKARTRLAELTGP